MNNFQIALVILLAVFVLINGASVLPILVLMLRPDTLKVAFDDPTDGQARISASPSLQEWIAKFQALGFSLIGIKREQPLLTGRTYREAALVSRDRDAYGSIVLHPGGSPASVYFFTPFRDGGMVFTRNHTSASEAEGPNLSVRNMVSADLGAMYDSHRLRLQELRAKGASPAVSASPEARVEATRMFYADAYARRPAPSMYLPGLAIFFFSVILLGLMVLWIISQSH
jgi:hypothetical protein